MNRRLSTGGTWPRHPGDKAYAEAQGVALSMVGE
jgi:hypothetical protein